LSNAISIIAFCYPADGNHWECAYLLSHQFQPGNAYGSACIVFGSCWKYGSCTDVTDIVEAADGKLGFISYRQADNLIIEISRQSVRVHIILTNMNTIRLQCQCQLHIIINNKWHLISGGQFLYRKSKVSKRFSCQGALSFFTQLE